MKRPSTPSLFENVRFSLSLSILIPRFKLNFHLTYYVLIMYDIFPHRISNISYNLERRISGKHEGGMITDIKSKGRCPNGTSPSGAMLKLARVNGPNITKGRAVKGGRRRRKRRSEKNGLHGRRFSAARHQRHEIDAAN